MEFEEVLFGRRSIRNFSDDNITDDDIDAILRAAVFAPSACNFEAWKFIVLNKDAAEAKKVLKNRVEVNAPYGILVVYRNDAYVTGRIRGDYIQSAAAAIQNMLLQIASMGLGACWVCDLPDDNEMRQAFGIPSNFDIVAYVAMGHPRTGDENSVQAMEYHYGDEESFRAHKRRYSVDQVKCSGKFETAPGDCTHAVLPKPPMSESPEPVKRKGKKRKRSKSIGARTCNRVRRTVRRLFKA